MGLLEAQNKADQRLGLFKDTVAQVEYEREEAERKLAEEMKAIRALKESGVVFNKENE